MVIGLVICYYKQVVTWAIACGCVLVGASVVGVWVLSFLFLVVVVA